MWLPVEFLTVQKGPLLRTIRRIGINKKLRDAIKADSESVSQFSKRYGFSTNHVCQLINRVFSPFDSNGMYHEWCSRLTQILGYNEEELLPARLYTQCDDVTSEALERLGGRVNRLACSDMDSFELVVQSELYARVHTTVRSLPNPLAKKVIEDRFGLGGNSHTFDELASRDSVSIEAVRKLEAKGLRLLRHPSRAGLLRDFI